MADDVIRRVRDYLGRFALAANDLPVDRPEWDGPTFGDLRALLAVAEAARDADLLCELACVQETAERRVPKRDTYFWRLSVAIKRHRDAVAALGGGEGGA